MPRSLWFDITESTDMFDRAESALIDEPTLNADANEPMLPMLSADPMLPIESTEPREPMQRKLSVEAMHHLPRSRSGTRSMPVTVRAATLVGKVRSAGKRLREGRGRSGPAT